MFDILKPVLMASSGDASGSSSSSSSACYVYPDSPPTIDITTPDISFNRVTYMNGSMTMDDGNQVTIWGFAEGTGAEVESGPFPSPAMRVSQGQVVHTNFYNSGMMWLHTIHHHGIEPSQENDGVGHYSFDVDDFYTYQWKASHAGTYFYHCHTNTVLHAEMGMYGALIIDPPEGPGTLFSGGPTYEHEFVWACDEIDSSWHNKSWAAGTCGGDEGFNSLNPDYFIISGVDGDQSALTHPGIAPTINVGDSLLIRYVCAGYLPQRINFGGLTATMHMSDGRALPNPVQTTSILASSAERYDCIIVPYQAGVYEVSIDFLHWVTGDVVGTARTRITVV